MKKWMLREEELILEQKKQFEAYNNELKKNGVLDTKEEEPKEEPKKVVRKSNKKKEVTKDGE